MNSKKKAIILILSTSIVLGVLLCFCSLALFFFLSSDLSNCNETQSDAVCIRIQNDSGYDIESFWLGSGGYASGKYSMSLGSIQAGEQSAYRSLGLTTANYRKFSFITVQGERYMFNGIDYQGSGQLTPGHYTFRISIVGDEVVTTVLKDR